MNTPSSSSPSSSPSSSDSLPLAGIKVIELHAIGPVPFVGQLLVSLGAQVTRVSPPNDPGLGVAIDPRFEVFHFDKQREYLDLKKPDGQAALHALLAQADVLMEGFRPGVLERLGLAPASLLERYPRLVIGRLSGWGLRGPLAERAGHDINYLALSGALDAIGTEQGPVAPLNLVADFGGGGMSLLVGILSKLVQRSVSGRGGTVETSILAGTVALTMMFYGMLAAGTWNSGRMRNVLDGAAPFYRTYRTSDDKFVAVGAIEAKFYRELLKVTGLAGTLDPAKEFDRDTWPRTTEIFAERFAQRTRDEWARLAEPVDCCLSPVLTFAEAAGTGHSRANGLHVDQPFARVGRIFEFDR